MPIICLFYVVKDKKLYSLSLNKISVLFYSANIHLMNGMHNFLEFFSVLAIFYENSLKNDWIFFQHKIFYLPTYK